MVFAIEKLKFILHIRRSTRNLTIFETIRPNPTRPIDNRIDSYSTNLVSVHSLVATSLILVNFASIKQLSHQGSVVEPELFDEFARTQKIPVDF